MKKILIMAFFLILPTRSLSAFKDLAIRRTLTGSVAKKRNILGNTSQSMAFSTKLNTLNERPEVMEKEQVAQLLAETGFPSKIVPMVTCLAQFESHFKTKVVNQNTNLTHDYGLLQINDVWLKDCKTTPEQLKNPGENAKCALKIYNQQGLTAWSTYKKFKKTCLAYHVDFVKYENIADIHISNQHKIEDLM